jgi:hypothetical protein
MTRPLGPRPRCHVRFGSKADIGASVTDVRFTPNSGHIFGPIRREELRLKNMVERRERNADFGRNTGFGGLHGFLSYRANQV